MSPGDLVSFVKDKPHLLTKFGGGAANASELAGIMPDNAVALVLAGPCGKLQECLVLGGGLLGWTYIDRLEAR